MTKSPDDWLRTAQADADRRGIPALKPLLVALADATRILRGASWNRSALDPPTSNRLRKPELPRDKPQ